MFHTGGMVEHQWQDNAPIYRQMRDRLIAMILEGRLCEGDPMPSVRVVASRYHINPITVLKSYQELVDAMASADVVVAQGGPGGITDARGVGHLPVVVPRQGTLGEHVDDHQVRFTAWMAERGLIELAADEAELHRYLDLALADPGALRIAPDAGSVAESVDRFRAIVDPLLAARAARPSKGRRLRRR